MSLNSTGTFARSELPAAKVMGAAATAAALCPATMVGGAKLGDAVLVAAVGGAGEGTVMVQPVNTASAAAAAPAAAITLFTLLLRRFTPSTVPMIRAGPGYNHSRRAPASALMVAGSGPMRSPSAYATSPAAATLTSLTRSMLTTGWEVCRPEKTSG